MSVRRVVPIEETEWQVAPPPAWVDCHEPDWDFSPPEGYPVAFLLIDEQHHTPTQTFSLRSVRKLLTLSAVQALGQVEIDFDPAAHRLLIHELAVWRRNSEGTWTKRSLARRESFMLRQREQQLEQQMLNGHVSMVALLEDVRVGDAIELAWTLEPRDSLPGLRFATFFALAWSTPVARAFFSLHRNESNALQWRIHSPSSPDVPRRPVLPRPRHLPPSLPSQSGTPLPIEDITPHRATWSLENPPIVVPEPNVPGNHWPLTIIDVSSWTTWREVAEFISDLWMEALAESPDAVAAEAERLRVEGDREASLRAAIRFVQEEIRYLAVDFGHGGGMLPNGAGTVLRRRFGDCKDKTVLLTALLRAMGFQAWPLLVAPNWRDAVKRVLPSTAAFSHAIVTFLSDAEGTRHFVDPTFLGQGGDLSHLMPPPYACGLEIRKGSEELLTIPERPQGEITLTEDFTLSRKHRNGTVEQTLRATGWLADDVRAILLREGPAAFFKKREEALKQHFPALSLSENTMRVEDDVAKNTIELRVRHALPTWGPATEQPPAIFRYGAHGLFLVVENITGPEKRLHPWALPYPVKIHHRVIVQGRCVRKTPPERHKFSGPGFRYTCDVNSERHKVLFDYQWETTRPEISPQDWPSYVRERTKAFEQAGANVQTPSSWSPQGTWPWWRWMILGLFPVYIFIKSALTDGSSPRTHERYPDLNSHLPSGQSTYEAQTMQKQDFLVTGPSSEKEQSHYFYSGFDNLLTRTNAGGAYGSLDRTNEAVPLEKSSSEPTPY